MSKNGRYSCRWIFGIKVSVKFADQVGMQRLHGLIFQEAYWFSEGKEIADLKGNIWIEFVSLNALEHGDSEATPINIKLVHSGIGRHGIVCHRRGEQ
ncbi:MAG: hypothetical protein ACLPX5_07935 [Dissulfurispiraceae bacterium]